MTSLMTSATFVLLPAVVFLLTDIMCVLTDGAGTEVSAQREGDPPQRPDTQQHHAGRGRQSHHQ